MRARTCTHDELVHYWAPRGAHTFPRRMGESRKLTYSFGPARTWICNACPSQAYAADETKQRVLTGSELLLDWVNRARRSAQREKRKKNQRVQTRKRLALKVFGEHRSAEKFRRLYETCNLWRDMLLTVTYSSTRRLHQFFVFPLENYFV